MREPSGFFRRNGLSLVLLALVLVTLTGQAFAGLFALNAELVEHGRAPLDLPHYLLSGHFIGATFENWESEFLQMGIYVLLTAVLYQRGSAESRPLVHEAEKGEDTPLARRPWPMRRSGAVRWLYEHSLCLALLLLFVASFVLHVLGSWRHHALEQRLAGQAADTLADYLHDPQLWFESLQNWQSEFMAVLALVVLSIFLRQRGSPQSKHVNSPHAQTGTERTRTRAAAQRELIPAREITSLTVSSRSPLTRREHGHSPWHVGC